MTEVAVENPSKKKFNLKIDSHDRIEQIKRELMGIQESDNAEDFVSPMKN
jgi:hypothetical protein